MGKEDELGIIKMGAFADITAGIGDIAMDISNAMFNIVFAMKNGEVYFEKLLTIANIG